ncbi:hypothetical protein D3C87_1971890 [compost metagenome]
MDFIDQRAFVVGLEIMQLHVRENPFQRFEIVVERLISIHAGFSFAQKIQVRAVQDQYLFHLLCSINKFFLRYVAKLHQTF